MKEGKNSKLINDLVSEPIAVYLAGLSQSGPSSGLIEFARKGVTMQYVIHLGHRLGLTLQHIANILHVSLRTLQRYPLDKKLDTDQSSKAILLANLHKRGVEVFGSDEAFGEWLNSPVPYLHGKRPLTYLDTPFGFDLLVQVLGRIEHGIFA
ncbi:MAG TPA: DUF2384 domain-containing protein [Saprospiraceae bacterium]|nr:DUF2384 domain-containing protein [Saprospiraceae bacterium]